MLGALIGAPAPRRGTKTKDGALDEQAPGPRGHDRPPELEAGPPEPLVDEARPQGRARLRRLDPRHLQVVVDVGVATEIGTALRRPLIPGPPEPHLVARHPLALEVPLVTLLGPVLSRLQVAAAAARKVVVVEA